MSLPGDCSRRLQGRMVNGSYPQCLTRSWFNSTRPYMSIEKAFQNYFIDIARKMGVSIFRINNVPGFPDVLICVGDKYKVVELKLTPATFTSNQIAFYKEHLHKTMNEIYCIVKAEKEYNIYRVTESFVSTLKNKRFTRDTVKLGAAYKTVREVISELIS